MTRQQWRPANGPQLREWRKEVSRSSGRHLSQARAAAEIGLSRTILSSAEAGRLCTLDSIHLIVDYYARRLDTRRVSFAAALADSARGSTESMAALTDPLRARASELACFAGPFTVHDVALLCRVDAGDAAATIAGLVSNGILDMSDDGDLHSMPRELRSRCLEELRAQSRLEELRRRHRDLVLTKLLTMEASLKDSRASVALKAFVTMRTDIVAALAWSIRGGHDPDVGLAVATAAASHWARLASIDEGVTWLERSLDALRATASRAKVISAVHALGRLEFERRHATRALEHFDDALALGPDGRMAAALLDVKGAALSDLGRFAEASACHARALRALRRLRDARGLAMSHSNWAVCQFQRGEKLRALLAWRRAAHAFAATGSGREKAMATVNVAMVLDDMGRFEEAARLLDDAESDFDLLGDQMQLARVYNNRGRVFRHLGRYAEAGTELDRSLEIKEALGDEIGRAYTLQEIGDVKRDTSDVAEALRAYATSGRLYFSLGCADGLALCAIAAGTLLVECGSERQGVALIAGGGRVADELELELERDDRTRYDACLKRARISLGAAFDVTWDGARQISQSVLCAMLGDVAR